MTDNNGQTHEIIQQSIGGPHLDLGKVPLAVMLDNATAGSGEQIAVAFA
jgi:hypothetical protein